MRTACLIANINMPTMSGLELLSPVVQLRRIADHFDCRYPDVRRKRALDEVYAAT